MKNHARMAFGLVCTLSACSGPKPEVPIDGCYYDRAGTAVLKVVGRKAQILITSDVRDLDLIPSGQNNIIARPAFYLIEAPERVVRNAAMATTELPIGSAPPTIGLPDAPDGYLTLTLGKPCLGSR